MALAGTPQLRSKGQVSVHEHRTKGVTGSEGRRGANGGGNRVGGGNGDGDGDGEERTGAGTGSEAETGTAMETERERDLGWRRENGSNARTGTGEETRAVVETGPERERERGLERRRQGEREWRGKRRALASAKAGNKQSRRPRIAIPPAASSL